MFRKVSVLFYKQKAFISKRFLSLQEYQSKNLLRSNGCIVQNFFVVSNMAEAKTKISNHCIL